MGRSGGDLDVKLNRKVMNKTYLTLWKGMKSLIGIHVTMEQVIDISS